MINYNKWEKFDENLRADDKRFNNSVVLCFEDGSNATFIHAFYIKDKDDIVVFTEHCGFHIYPEQSLEYRYLLKFDEFKEEENEVDKKISKKSEK